MGFHTCTFCTQKEGHRFQPFSSGDVTLIFTNGNKWELPDMVLHYIDSHRWLPPAKFIQDVLNVPLDESARRQTRSGLLTKADRVDLAKIGYLANHFPQGDVPTDFIEKLEALMKQAGSMGLRLQTKGVVVYRGEAQPA